MAEIATYRELIVWQKSMDLAEEVYRLVKEFPQAERFGLTGQLTRAVVSVPANIAEGHGRATRPDYANFVSIARGSLQEAETMLLLAIRLGYIALAAADFALSLISEVSKMLTVLLRKLRTPQPL